MPRAPRNILYIGTDQQRPDTIGAYGNPQIRTPNVDRLAAGAVLFEQAYCAQPTCSPSRASAVTGVYPHLHGVLPWATVPGGIRLPASIPTLAELLRPAGYACGYVGKWHLGDEVKAQRGFFDLWASTEDGYTGDHQADGYSAYHRFLVSRGYVPQDPTGNGVGFARGRAARLPEDVGKPAFQAESAIRFLEAHRDEPFYLVCNFLEPHDPYFGPFDGAYRAEDMVLPESWYRPTEETVPLRYRLRRRAYETRPQHVEVNSELGWKQLKARYWGSASLVDKYAGLIVQRLEALGLADDTIVVYSTDHGDMMGEHHMLQKSMPFEGAAHVPLLVRAPGLAPRRVTTPVSQVDLVPTLLDLVGQPAPAHVQGRSLRPLLEQGDRDPDAAVVVVEWNGILRTAQLERMLREHQVAGVDGLDPRLTEMNVRSVRRGRWKLNVHASGEHELYDVAHDPGELHNAFYDAGAGDVVAGLYRRLSEWQRETADGMPLPDPIRTPRASSAGTGGDVG